MEAYTPAPVATADRIKSIDAIRGVALLGILLMNIPGFGINWDYFLNLVAGPRSGSDYYSFAAIMTIFEGTMRGLFSMLFGAGMVLFMMNKKDVPGQPPVAEYYYRRLLWLVFFGIINAFVLLWFGDILYYYGLCGMILFAFRKFKAKWLILIGLACVSFGMIKKQWNYDEFRAKRVAYNDAMAAKKQKKELTEKQQGAIAVWTEVEKGIKPDTAFMNEHLRSMRGGYFTVFNHLIPINVDGEVNYMYGDAWDMLSMMFIGMGLFVLGFFTNKLRTSTYVLCLLLGYGIGLPVAWMQFNDFWMGYLNIGHYLDSYTTSHQVYAELRRIPITIGHASLIMLIYKSRAVPWLMKLLANVGQMAFTNYLMQSIICTIFFYGYGLGYYNKLYYHQLYYVVLAVWVFQLIFSAIWLRYFKFGPFEWLWRSLTYWKKQPMRK